MTQNRTGKLGAYWALLRPTHWVKNSFVLAPLLFSREFRDFDQCIQALIATLSFCLISSVIYIFNDLRDRQEDQQHPEKKHRPLAGGKISAREAKALILILAHLGIAVAVLVNIRFLIVALIYIGLNIMYSLGLKQVAILDVMIIAAGFVLRILGGSVALENVEPSHWLVLCTIMISLFLGFSKRRTELVSIEQAGDTTRKVLRYYSLRFLDQTIAMVTAATLSVIPSTRWTITPSRS